MIGKPAGGWGGPLKLLAIAVVSAVAIGLAGRKIVHFFKGDDFKKTTAKHMPQAGEAFARPAAAAPVGVVGPSPVVAGTDTAAGRYPGSWPDGAWSRDSLGLFRREKALSIMKQGRWFQVETERGTYELERWTLDLRVFALLKGPGGDWVVFGRDFSNVVKRVVCEVGPWERGTDQPAFRESDKTAGAVSVPAAVSTDPAADFERRQGEAWHLGQAKGKAGKVMVR